MVMLQCVATHAQAVVAMNAAEECGKGRILEQTLGSECSIHHNCVTIHTWYPETPSSMQDSSERRASGPCNSIQKENDFLVLAAQTTSEAPRAHCTIV